MGDTAVQFPFLAEEYAGLLEMLELDDDSVMPWCENTRSAQTESSCPQLPFSHCDYQEVSPTELELYNLQSYWNDLSNLEKKMILSGSPKWSKSDFLAFNEVKSYCSEWLTNTTFQSLLHGYRF